MSKLISNLGYIGIGKQTSKGNPASSSTYFIKYLDASFKTETPISPLREGGDGEYVVNTIKNSHKEKATIKLMARPRAVAYLLAYFLGKDVVTGAGDPYTHVITRGSSRLWFTLFRKVNTNVVQRLEDCKISKITIDGDAGKEIMMSVDIEACNVTILSSEETPSYETEKPFVFYHGAGRYIVDTAVTSDIKKFSVTLDIKGDGLQTDELVCNDITDLALDVNVSADLYAIDSGNWKKANYYNTALPSESSYTGGLVVDLQHTTASRQFKIEVPKFIWNEIDLPMKGTPDVITETIAGIGMKGTGEIVTITSKNDVSSDIATDGS